MEWIEVTGRSLKDATELALDRLGVSESDLEYEVLTDARSGFLGMGRSDARIRARVKPISREKPDDRRRRGRGRGRRGDGETESDDRSRSGAAEQSSRDQPGRNRKSNGGRQKTGAAKPGGGRSGSGKSRGPKQPSAGRRASSSPDQPAGSTSDRGTRMTEQDDATLDEQCALAEDFLRGVLDALEIDAKVSSDTSEDRVEAAIEGAGLGVLIGPGGATLTAIEELTQAVVKTHGGGSAAKVRVDAAGYWEQRREALEGFSREMAERVRSTGEELSLEPMGSRDRKVVHDAISEFTDLETTSEGDEPRRRVVIRPGA